MTAGTKRSNNPHPTTPSLEDRMRRAYDHARSRPLDPPTDGSLMAFQGALLFDPQADRPSNPAAAQNDD